MEMDLTVGRPYKVILRFVIPLIIGNVFQQFYNMVDMIIVGRFVGSDALAAVGSTGTIMFLVLGFCSGLAAGFSVLTSQCYGAGQKDRTRHSAANAILLTVIISIVMTALSCLSMRSVLHLMNTPENIFEDAYTYIFIVCAGTACSMFYNLLASLLRAVGNSKVPLFFLIFSASLNIVLDLILVVPMRMGTAGAALATDMAQGISVVLCFFYIYKKVPVIRPGRHDWYLSGSDSACQLKVALPMALQYAITASGTMVMQAAINIYGSVAVASFTAASKMTGLFTQVYVSLGQAMATYCGQNYGKGDLPHLRAGVRESLWLSLIMTVLMGAAVILLGRPLMHLFFTGSADFSQIMGWARPYLITAVICFYPLGLIFIFRNSMQASGYALLPMMGGVVELLTRLATSLISMRIHSYTLACVSDAAAWVTAGLFFTICWVRVSRKMKL